MLSTQSKTNLRKALAASFDIEELKNLCVDLGLDYEDFPSLSKKVMVRELIEEVERLGKTNDLIELCIQVRPNTNWNSIVALSAEGEIPDPQSIVHTQVSENQQVDVPSGNQKGGGKWWVPIVVALIGLIGVLIAAILNANPDIISGYLPIVPTETPTLSPTSIPYRVQVFSDETNEKIRNAEVTLQISRQTQVSDFSDSDGLARIIIDSSLVNQPAKLIVEARGYETYTKNTNTVEDDLPDEIRLKPEIGTPSVTPQPTETGASSPTSFITPTVIYTPTHLPTSIPTQLPSSTSTETKTPPTQARIIDGANPNLRPGPGESFRDSVVLEGVETVEIIARNRDSSWYLVKANGYENGWIAANLVEVIDPASDLIPLAVTIPVPPTLATSSPTQDPTAPTETPGSINGGGGNGGDRTATPSTPILLTPPL